MGTHTYQTKRCPHCNKVYSQRSFYGPDASEQMVVFGPLFVKCPACGQMFRDGDAVELAFMDPPASYLRRFHLSNLLFAAMFGGCGVYILIKGLEEGNILFGAILLCLAFVAALLGSDYVRYCRNVKTVERERVNSVNRLKNDPVYALALKMAGYAVPEEYLPKAPAEDAP